MRRFLHIILLLVMALLTSCNNAGKNGMPRDLDDIIQSDTLIVATLYGPISYFSYKESEMGYEYEYVRFLCKELGVERPHVKPPS